MFGRDKNKSKEQLNIPSASLGIKTQETSAAVHMAAPPTIGLALGSGVARGFAHLGVVRALRRHGIEPTIVSGASIGSLVGGAYLSNRLDALEEWAYSLNRSKVLSYLDFSLTRSGGLIGGDKLNRLMTDNFGNIRVEDLPHPFISVCADLVTGHEVWLRKGKLVDVMRASFSLPGIFPPMFINGRWLVDGALVNPVPVSACAAQGARMTIAVNVSGDIIGKAKRPGDNVPTVAGFDIMNFEGSEQVDKAKSSNLFQRVFKRETGKPSLFGVMVSSLNIMQDRLARSRLAGDPPDVLIVPRVGHIGIMEFDRAEELIEEGEASVERALPDIKAAYSVLCTQFSEDDGHI